MTSRVSRPTDASTGVSSMTASSGLTQNSLLEKIRKLQRVDSENRRCAVCGDVGTTYVCLDFGSFVCTSCSGIHREFHHKVKGISVSKWSSEEVEFIANHGNKKAKEVYLATWPDEGLNSREPGNIDKLRQFVRSAFVEKRWMARDSPVGSLGPSSGARAKKARKSRRRETLSSSDSSVSPPPRIPPKRGQASPRRRKKQQPDMLDLSVDDEHKSKSPPRRSEEPSRKSKSRAVRSSSSSSKSSTSSSNYKQRHRARSSRRRQHHITKPSHHQKSSHHQKRRSKRAPQREDEQTTDGGDGWVADFRQFSADPFSQQQQARSPSITTPWSMVQVPPHPTTASQFPPNTFPSTLGGSNPFGQSARQMPMAGGWEGQLSSLDVFGPSASSNPVPTTAPPRYSGDPFAEIHKTAASHTGSPSMSPFTSSPTASTAGGASATPSSVLLGSDLLSNLGSLGQQQSVVSIPPTPYQVSGPGTTTPLIPGTHSSGPSVSRFGEYESATGTLNFTENQRQQYAALQRQQQFLAMQMRSLEKAIASNPPIEDTSRHTGIHLFNNTGMQPFNSTGGFSPRHSSRNPDSMASPVRTISSSSIGFRSPAAQHPTPPPQHVSSIAQHSAAADGQQIFGTSLPSAEGCDDDFDCFSSLRELSDVLPSGRAENLNESEKLTAGRRDDANLLIDLPITLGMNGTNGKDTTETTLNLNPSPLLSEGFEPGSEDIFGSGVFGGGSSKGGGGVVLSEEASSAEPQVQPCPKFPLPTSSSENGFQADFSLTPPLPTSFAAGGLFSSSEGIFGSGPVNDVLF